MTCGVSPLNAWDKAFAAGTSVEALVAHALNHAYGTVVEQNNETNSQEVDLRYAGTIDVKRLTSPYPRTPTPAGLSAEEHLTLDYKNLFDYPDDTMIVCVVDYTPAQPTKGIYKISAKRAREIVAQNPERVYIRSSRTFSDKKKKVGISTRECGLEILPGAATKEASVDLLMTAQKTALAA